jgi:eukaryotic-like serine/threonine-protein kinase
MAPTRQPPRHFIPSPPMIGAKLGSWVLEKELGRGGMGQVYLARQEPPPADGPRRAAVKVLAAELAVEPGFLLRFRREIDVLRQLDHPHIVRFLESGAQDGRFYFVMEYVDGPTFQELLEEQGRLPWPEVLDLALQIAPALKHAHDRGIVHRDVKPANLMRVQNGPETPGTVKLTDFGIAALFASEHLTVTGGVVGTAEYLSPEQAAGKPVTRRSDLYSLGVVLYTLLTGQTPFSGAILDLLQKHRFGQFDRPRRIVPDVPHDLDDVVCQLLEKEPARRPADGAVLYRRLERIRRKLERQTEAQAEGKSGVPSTQIIAGLAREGPATLMSRLMRSELDRQIHGGPLRRFFNRPLVLLILFLATAGLLAWGLWPLDAEGLFQRGAALMRSENPDDWYKAWHDYLTPLEEKFPDHAHRSEVEGFRRLYEDYQAEREAELQAQRGGPLSEARWFFYQGLRLRRGGDEAGAQRVWKGLIEGYGQVPAARPWVRRAERGLAGRDEPDSSLDGLREALKRAQRLRDEGRAEEADAIRRALEDLYRDDPAGRKLLGEGK